MQIQSQSLPQTYRKKTKQNSPLPLCTTNHKSEVCTASDPHLKRKVSPEPCSVLKNIPFAKVIENVGTVFRVTMSDLKNKTTSKIRNKRRKHTKNTGHRKEIDLPRELRETPLHVSTLYRGTKAFLATGSEGMHPGSERQSRVG